MQGAEKSETVFCRGCSDHFMFDFRSAVLKPVHLHSALSGLLPQAVQLLLYFPNAFLKPFQNKTVVDCCYLGSLLLIILSRHYYGHFCQFLLKPHKKVVIAVFPVHAIEICTFSSVRRALEPFSLTQLKRCYKNVFISLSKTAYRNLERM